MNQKVLAITTDGRITYCTCAPDQRGKGRCNHVLHQLDGESNADFMKRATSEIKVTEDKEKVMPNVAENPISEKDIESLRKQIYSLCGTEDVTSDNIKDVLANLDHETQRKIMEIGFEAGKYFDFVITNDNIEAKDLETKIYFSNMGDFGLGAKKSHINEILGSIGSTVGENGEIQINNNYVKGLTEEEWWSLQYATRMASVNKTVSIAAPGAEARNLFYGLSDTLLIDDCQDDSSTGILTCHAPGGFCEKCARKSGMGKAIDILKKGSPEGGISGVRIGGFVSTNLSEPLTQSYLNAIHGANDPKANQHKVLVQTFEGFAASPIIQEARQAKTTQEARQILFTRLKEAYADQGIDIDDFNLEIIAKKMTSYKKGPNGLEFCEPGDLCTIVSIKSIGNRGNIFKKASMGSSFKLLSRGGVSKKNLNDSFNSFTDISNKKN